MYVAVRLELLFLYERQTHVSPSCDIRLKHYLVLGIEPTYHHRHSFAALLVHRLFCTSYV